MVAAIALLLTVVVAAAAGWWCRSRCPGRRGYYTGTRRGARVAAGVSLFGGNRCFCLSQDVYKLCKEVVSSQVQF